MNDERGFERATRDWLDAGTDVTPPHLIDAVLLAVRTTPQERGLRVPWRTPIMNKLVFGLGAAALVVIGLFLGGQLLGSPADLGGSGGPASTPEPTAIAEPSPTTEASQSDAAGLPEGPHVLLAAAEHGVPITVTIDAPGWVGQPDEGFLERGVNGADPPDGAGMIGFNEGEYYVYEDACHWSTTTPDTPATTVDELVEALARQASREPSAPEDITVDGYAGKKIVLDMADEYLEGDSHMVDCDESEFALFGTPRHDPARISQGPGQTDEVWALDVDGLLVVLVAGYYAETPQNAVDEVLAILNSTTFDE